MFSAPFLLIWVRNDLRGGTGDNGGQRWDKPVGLSPALFAKPPVSLRESLCRLTWWSWCIRTLMVHAADLLGQWVHSNNTQCVCLHPWDNLMRMYPLAADSGGRAAGCSCCHQGFNHSPLSAWHTQDTVVSAGILMALLQDSRCSTYIDIYTETFAVCAFQDCGRCCCTTVAWKSQYLDSVEVHPHTARFHPGAQGWCGDGAPSRLGVKSLLTLSARAALWGDSPE